MVLVLNLALAGLWLFSGGYQQPVFLWLGTVYLYIVLQVVAGILPRISSILALGMLGIFQFPSPLSMTQLALAAAYTVVIFLGGGDFSIWNPEEPLIVQRIGREAHTALEQGA